MRPRVLVALQDALKALGIKVKLGALNLEVKDVLLRFANRRIETDVGVIEQGLLIKGSLSLIGMRADVLFAIDPDGMDLAVDLDFSGIMNAIYKAAQSVLDA